MVNSRKREATGPEIAGYIADMLPEMSRLAREHKMDNLADLLESALTEALRCRNAFGGDNIIRLS
jgi:hypothetical protein